MKPITLSISLLLLLALGACGSSPPKPEAKPEYIVVHDSAPAYAVQQAAAATWFQDRHGRYYRLSADGYRVYQ